MLVSRLLLLQHALVLLREKKRRVNCVRLIVERRHHFSCEIPLEDMGASSLIDVMKVTKARPDVHAIMLLGDRANVPDEVSKSRSTGGTSRFQDNLHPGRRHGVGQFSGNGVVGGDVTAYMKE